MNDQKRIPMDFGPAAGFGALAPDELAAAADAAEAHPDDVPHADVAALAHIARHHPELAHTLVNQHASDTALSAAVRRAVSSPAFRAGQSASQSPGEDGERGAGAPAGDAAAGEPGQPGGAEGEVGRGDGGAEEVGGQAGLLPRTWLSHDGAILGGNPPADAPPPLPRRDHTLVDRSGAVGLVGGLSCDRRRVLIDSRMPHQLWMPEHRGQDGTMVPGHWESVDDEIVAHELAENTPPDNIDAKGYQRAHDEDGNAGTRRHLARSNTDPKVYSNVLRPYAEAIRGSVADDPGDVHPELDPRPYVDGGYGGLLGRRRPEAGGFFDQDGVYHHPLAKGCLLGDTDVIYTRMGDGCFGVLHPPSGIVLSRARIHPLAIGMAERLAQRLGRRRLRAMLDLATKPGETSFDQPDRVLR